MYYVYVWTKSRTYKANLKFEFSTYFKTFCNEQIYDAWTYLKTLILILEHSICVYYSFVFVCRRITADAPRGRTEVAWGSVIKVAVQWDLAVQSP